MSPVQPRRTRKRGARTPDDRFATWLRRLRWPAVIAWVLAMAALYGLSGSLSGVTNDQASAYLPASAASTRVVLLQQAAAQAASRAGGQEGSAAIAVFASSGPLTPADQAAIGPRAPLWPLSPVMPRASRRLVRFSGRRTARPSRSA
jgi:hypothetical protein